MNIPNDWIAKISNDEWRDIAERLVGLSLQIPPIKDKVLELIWLICTEDARKNLKKE